MSSPGVVDSKPTHRRGPIAAEYKSPGPGYILSNLCGVEKHDISSKYKRGAAFSFGTKPKTSSNINSPGPCYAIASNITNRGRCSAPSFSLCFRQKPIKKYATPSPCAYTIGMGNKSNPPVHTFGFRHALPAQNTSKTPSPNAYTLPEVIGSKTPQSHIRQAPKFTMSGRNNRNDSSGKNQIPGPGTYRIVDINKVSHKAPAFSMLGSARDDTTNHDRKNNKKGATNKRNYEQTPGPAHYGFCDNRASRRCAPKFSFGVRHSPYMTTVIVDE
ncbi:MAG: Outer dense fiber protein 3 [Marteilia pararefringens]